MPSSGSSSRAGRTFAIAARTFQVRVLIASICIAMGGQLSAQMSNAAKLIHEAEVRESALRREIDTREAGALATPLLDRARTLVRSFEDISRLFASSPYGDDALWHGGMLAADTFWEFGQPDDRTTAVRLLKGLGTRYPRSSLVSVGEILRAATNGAEKPHAAAVGTVPSRDTDSTARSDRHERGRCRNAPEAAALILIRDIKRAAIPDGSNHHRDGWETTSANGSRILVSVSI
jgi:hypothetical protein